MFRPSHARLSSDARAAQRRPTHRSIQPRVCSLCQVCPEIVRQAGRRQNSAQISPPLRIATLASCGDVNLTLWMTFGGSVMRGIEQHETRWTNVYRDLRHDIERGVYAPGDDLPTISSLAKSTGLTTHGARRAMERLSAEGRAQSWQGKGFRVAMPKVSLDLKVRRPVFGERVRALGFATTSEVVSSKQQGLPRHLAKRMRYRAGTEVLCTETLRKVNGCVVALSIDYFHKGRLNGIVETLAETGSVSRSLAIHGVSSYERDYTSFEARLPTAHEALLLGIPKQQPVYATLGANIAEDGSIVQISKGVWRGDCVVYQA